MEEITLTRTGRAPLTFRGELLAESDGRLQSSREQNRWHELTVYRTAGGKFVLWVAYRTQWQGELGRDTVEVLDSPGAVAAALENYNPCGPVQGYPAGDAYTEKQRRLTRDVRTRYEAQVSDMLGRHPEFAEKVE